MLERYSVYSCARSQSLMPALVPDSADGQGNGKDTKPKKDIKILTYTVILPLRDQLIQGKQDRLQCRVL